MEEQVSDTSAIESLETTLKSNFDQLRQKQQARLEQISALMSSLEDVSKNSASDGEDLHGMADGALSQLQVAKSEIGSASEIQRELQARIDDLNSALENSEREKAGLAEKIHSGEAEREGLNAAHAELSAKNEAYEELQREFEELRRIHDNEHGELVTYRDRARELDQQLTQLKEDVASQSSSTQHFEDRIAALEGELEAKSSALEDALASLESSQSSLESAQEDKNRVTAELEAMAEASQQSGTAQEALKTELIAVQRETEALREKYKEGLSTEAALALRQQVTETVEQVRRLESELNETRGQSKKSVLARQLAEAIGEAEQASEENKALRQEIDLLREGRASQSGADETEAETTRPPELMRRDVPHTPEEILRRIQDSAKGHSNGPKRVIGQILLDAGIISDEQLQQALELQKSNPQQHLGAILTELGFASDETVAQARASQCGVEFIRFDEDTVDPKAAALISERLANQHSCIPISASARSMVLAVTNPMDLLAIEDVERFTNKKVDVVVGTVPEIVSAISRYYWEPE